MKTLKDCKDEIAVKEGCKSWNDLLDRYYTGDGLNELDQTVNELLELYSSQLQERYFTADQIRMIEEQAYEHGYQAGQTPNEVFNYGF